MFSAPIPPNDEARLATLLRYSILDTPAERAYDDITSLAAYVCGTPFSTITLVDRDRQWFKSEVGFGTNETGRADGFCACAMLSPETMIVEDALLDPRFAANPFVLGGPRIRFYAGAPLIAPNGHILGTVCVFDSRPRRLAPEQIAALEAMSRQVMTQLELRLKLIETQAAAAGLRTAEKLAVVGRLASSVAHEINNPLQSMTNLLYMAAGSTADHASGPFIAQAQEELQRVAHIVTQTLRFHRQSDRARPLMMTEVVKSVLNLFRTRLQHARITVEIADRQTRPVVCYASDIRQVVANLVGNAIDALIAVGGGRLIIRMRDSRRLSDNKQGVRVTIADTGSGMDKETRSHLFEPFFSTKGARGTGLGLWVSHEILEKHSARVAVRSAKDSAARGTVFALFFPQACDQTPLSVPASRPEDTREGAGEMIPGPQDGRRGEIKGEA